MATMSVREPLSSSSSASAALSGAAGSSSASPRPSLELTTVKMLSRSASLMSLPSKAKSDSCLFFCSDPSNRAAPLWPTRFRERSSSSKKTLRSRPTTMPSAPMSPTLFSCKLSTLSARLLMRARPRPLAPASPTQLLPSSSSFRALFFLSASDSAKVPESVMQLSRTLNTWRLRFRSKPPARCVNPWSPKSLRLTRSSRRPRLRTRAAPRICAPSSPRPARERSSSWSTRFFSSAAASAAHPLVPIWLPIKSRVEREHSASMSAEANFSAATGPRPQRHRSSSLSGFPLRAIAVASAEAAVSPRALSRSRSDESTLVCSRAAATLSAPGSSMQVDDKSSFRNWAPCSRATAKHSAPTLPIRLLWPRLSSRRVLFWHRASAKRFEPASLTLQLRRPKIAKQRFFSSAVAIAQMPLSLRRLRPKSSSVKALCLASTVASRLIASMSNSASSRSRDSSSGSSSSASTMAPPAPERFAQPMP
mmetsp:Transcript_25032/g.79587  ORF Transcript_25032/g.79587 Transcript_25032/m.79587 type:complete len:479 (-) Transcript_25032:7-1443(-)